MIILVSMYKCGDEELVEKTTATQLGKCHSAGHKPSLQLGVRGDQGQRERGAVPKLRVGEGAPQAGRVHEGGSGRQAHCGRLITASSDRRLLSIRPSQSRKLRLREAKVTTPRSTKGR